MTSVTFSCSPFGMLSCVSLLTQSTPQTGQKKKLRAGLINPLCPFCLSCFLSCDLVCRDRKVQDEGMVVRSFVLDLRISSDNAKLGLISIVFFFISFSFGWIQQERLRHWESRERKKLRDYDKLELKEKERIEEQQKQAVWLKQFLEDYDDERDDSKYYK